MSPSKFTSLFALLCLLPMMGQAQTVANRVEPLEKQERKQERIELSASQSATLLAEVLDEFERNGLEGTDVEIIGAMQTVLGQVSGELMPEILEQLKTARTTDQGAQRRSQALLAHAGQKSAAYQMRQVLLEYQRQLALYQLAERLQVLGDRQSSNLHDTVAMVQASQKPSAAQRRNDFAISRQLQETEQESLQREVGLVMKSLTALVSLQEGTLENRPQAAVTFATEQQLLPALKSAHEDLKKNSLMSAAGHEKSARDTLWRLVTILQPDRDPLDLLLAALAKLDELIEDEEEVITKTDDLDNKKRTQAEDLIMQDERVVRIEAQIANMERRLERANAREQVRLSDSLERTRRRLANEIAKARERLGVDTSEMSDLRRAERVLRQQGVVVDRTDFLRQEVSELVPEVSSSLKEAIAPMQEARVALAATGDPATKKAAALPPEKTALAKLQEAREKLLEEIEKAQFVEETPGDKLSELKELLEKVQELKKEEQAIQAESAKAETANESGDLQETQAPAQEAVKEKTEAVQREAQSPSPEAAQALGDAAEQMEASQLSLEQGENAPLAQQAAIDSLIQAEETLKAEIADLEQAQEDLEALKELREKVDEVIRDQLEVQKDTIDEIAKPAAETSEKLAEKQSELGETTEGLQAEAESPAPEAAESLGAAGEAMEAASSELGQTDPLAAQPKQGEAIAQLEKARAQLSEKIAELEAQLGENPSEPQANLDEAIAAIEKAQGEVTDALEQLDPQANAAGQLQERQEALAESLGEAAQVGNEAAAAAQPSAAAAAQQLAEGDVAGAIGEMKKAEGALAGEPGSEGAAQEQGDIREAAEALAAGSQPSASPLQEANSGISPLSSGSKGSLPLGAQGALQQAQQSLANAAAQANAGSPTNSQGQAQAAQGSLAQAAAALALAKAGLSPGDQPGQGEGPGEGQAQGQGEGQGEGQGQGQGEGQGKGQGQGQGKGEGQGKGQGQGEKGNGNEGNWQGPGGADGHRRLRSGVSKHISLPKRERGHLRQSQGRGYSPEYGRMIEQYLKNLSDSASAK